MKKHLFSQWSKTLLISTALLGGVGAVVMQNHTTPAQKVEAAAGRITYTDDSTGDTIGFAMTAGGGSDIIGDLPAGYTLTPGQSGMFVIGNQYCIDTTKVGGGVYTVHLTPTPAKTLATRATGTIEAYDENNVKFSTMEVTSLSNGVLTMAVPAGYVDAGNQLPGVFVTRNTIYVDTNVAAGQLGLPLYYVRLQSADGVVKPAASATVSFKDADTDDLASATAFRTLGSYDLKIQLPDGYSLATKQTDPVKQAGADTVIDTSASHFGTYTVYVQKAKTKTQIGQALSVTKDQYYDNLPQSKCRRVLL